jgi:hypothetical protein
VWSFVARRPVTVSAVTWSLMLITTKVVLDLGRGKSITGRLLQEQGWGAGLW